MVVIIRMDLYNLNEETEEREPIDLTPDQQDEMDMDIQRGLDKVGLHVNDIWFLEESAAELLSRDLDRNLQPID